MSLDRLLAEARAEVARIQRERREFTCPVGIYNDAYDAIMARYADLGRQEHDAKIRARALKDAQAAALGSEGQGGS